MAQAAGARRTGQDGRATPSGVSGHRSEADGQPQDGQPQDGQPQDGLLQAARFGRQDTGPASAGRQAGEGEDARTPGSRRPGSSPGRPGSFGDRPPARRGPAPGRSGSRTQGPERRPSPRGGEYSRGTRLRRSTSPSRGPAPYEPTRPRSGPARTGSLPEIPASINENQLDPAAAAELRTLPGDLASAVGRRLLAASLADDPEAGYQHALEARRLAARVGIVRETTGIAAYRAGHWAEALAELRAARRLTGRTSYLPMLADSERALGRIDRALGVIAESAKFTLDRATEVELHIVESGIRRDQGLAEAAVVALQLPELKERRMRPWSARLFYAYADALLDAGRTEQAREWFARAAATDRDEETNAAERFDELDDVVIDDLDDEDDEDEDDAGGDDEDREDAGADGA